MAVVPFQHRLWFPVFGFPVHMVFNKIDILVFFNHAGGILFFLILPGTVVAVATYGVFK